MPVFHKRHTLWYCPAVINTTSYCLSSACWKVCFKPPHSLNLDQYFVNGMHDASKNAFCSQRINSFAFWTFGVEFTRSLGSTHKLLQIFDFWGRVYFAKNAFCSQRINSYRFSTFGGEFTSPKTDCRTDAREHSEFSSCCDPFIAFLSPKLETVAHFRL